MLALPEYAITPNTIHCMDALQLCNALPDKSVDMILTDPPYGLYGNPFVVRADTGKRYERVNEKWDSIVPTKWMNQSSRLLRDGGSVVCFGDRQSIYKIASEGFSLGWKLLNDVTWFKPDAPPNFTGRMMTESTERFLWFCPSGTRWTYNNRVAKQLNGGIGFRDVWSFNVCKPPRFHPTQKPLDLIVQIILLMTKEGDTILDPFCGSGTTALAAHKTGRKYICGDFTCEYVNIARKRLQDADPYQATKLDDTHTQLSLFEQLQTS